MADVLDALIDADEVCLALPVRLELLAGVAKHDRRALLRALAALPHWCPPKTPGRHSLAGSGGERFAITDLLIASLATEIGGPRRSGPCL